MFGSEKAYDLKELLDSLKQAKVVALEKSSPYNLACAMFAYYDHDYDKAIDILDKLEDSPNKYRLMGIVTTHIGDDAKEANNMREANNLYQKAYNYFYKAEKLLTKEEYQLFNKNQFDLHPGKKHLLTKTTTPFAQRKPLFVRHTDSTNGKEQFRSFCKTYHCG